MKSFKSSVASLLALSVIATLAASTNVKVPFIGYGDNSGFDQLAATVVSINGDITTYNVNCPATSVWFCAESEPPFTLISGPSTYDFELKDSNLDYSRTACTLTGTPWPTTGTCSGTFTNHIGTYTTSSEYTYTVPNTNWVNPPLYSIYTATLVVVATSTEPASAGASPTSSSVTSTKVTKSVASDTPQITSSSGIVSGVVKSSTSPNGAKKTMVPLMFVVGGLAGAAGAM